MPSPSSALPERAAGPDYDRIKPADWLRAAISIGITAGLLMLVAMTAF